MKNDELLLNGRNTRREAAQVYIHYYSSVWYSQRHDQYITSTPQTYLPLVISVFAIDIVNVKNEQSQFSEKLPKIRASGKVEALLMEQGVSYTEVEWFL